MRKLLFIITGLIALTFVGCVDVLEKSQETNIPSLKISSDNQEISVEKGEYEWTTKVWFLTDQSIIADAASPEQIAKEMTGDKVTSETQLNLEFTEKPNKVTVIPWGEFKDVEYTSTEDTIIVPKKEGTYIFEVIGEWNQGKVSYTTKVIVENN